MRPVLKQVAELIGGAIRDLRLSIEPRVKSLEEANATKYQIFDESLAQVSQAIKKLEEAQQNPVTLENIVRQVIKDLREADLALVESCREAALSHFKESESDLSTKIESLKALFEKLPSLESIVEAAAKKLLELYPPPLNAAEIAAAAAALVPKPQDGKTFTLEEVEALVSKAVAHVKAPTADEVAASLAASHLPQWELDFERRAQDLMQRTIDRIPTPKDGLDGLGFEDLTVEHDGIRTFTFAMVKDARRKTFEFKVPVMIYRGIFDDSCVYDKGDVATWGGSSWIALKDAPQGKPGSSHDWQLIVKKGRDGSSK